MMLFKCSFRPARSLFVSYVHQHDPLGFGIAFVDLVPVATEKDRQSYPVEYYFLIGGRVLRGQGPQE